MHQEWESRMRRGLSGTQLEEERFNGTWSPLSLWGSVIGQREQTWSVVARSWAKTNQWIETTAESSHFIVKKKKKILIVRAAQIRDELPCIVVSSSSLKVCKTVLNSRDWIGWPLSPELLSFTHPAEDTLITAMSPETLPMPSIEFLSQPSY